jgi:type II secretory pathway pseudopilin PulG
MDRISHDFPVADRASKTRHGLNVIELIVIVAILAVIGALLLPGFRSVGPAARRTQCLNRIRNIALALSNYKSEYNVYPPAYTVDAHGKPLHSWRTLILPYLDQNGLYKKIDLSKPWNDPANAKLAETYVSDYTCPEAQCPADCTTYLAMVTPDGCLRASKLPDPSEVADAGNALMLIEVDSKHAVPWMSPQDADEALWLSIGPKGDLPHAGGSHVAHVDCRAYLVPADLPTDDRRAMMGVLQNRK